MFTDKFEKKASNLVRGLEHAGLATLAAPSVVGLASKDTPKKEKVKDAAEIGGLGLLHLGVEAAHEGSAVNKAAKKYFPKIMKA